MDQSSKRNKRKSKVPKKLISTEEEEKKSVSCIPPTTTASNNSSSYQSAPVSKPVPFIPSTITAAASNSSSYQLARVSKPVPSIPLIPSTSASITSYQRAPASKPWTSIYSTTSMASYQRAPVSRSVPSNPSTRASISSYQTAPRASVPTKAKQPSPGSSSSSSSTPTPEPRPGPSKINPTHQTPTNKPNPRPINYNNKDHPEIMTFTPTWEEFQDFHKYINYMESVGAHLGGIAKIIPPPEYQPLDKSAFANLNKMIIPAPLLQIKSTTDQIGVYQNVNIVQKSMTVGEFYTTANSPEYLPPEISTNLTEDEKDEELEKKFWKLLLYSQDNKHPIYGSDTNGTLTKVNYPYWNINNLNTILNLIKDESNLIIGGVNTAYLYFGMWKTVFCWHTEDMDLYSINLLHFGASKTWFAIPPKFGKKFEGIVKTYFPEEIKDCVGFLRHKTTLLNPNLLKRYNLICNKIVQRQGEIIITFPFGYHSGFNNGFNIAESTNFAMKRWIDYGKRAIFCTCHDKPAKAKEDEEDDDEVENAKIVKIDMEPFVRKYQPLETYKLWLAGMEKGIHPEDDPKTTKPSFAPKPLTKKLMKKKMKKKVDVDDEDGNNKDNSAADAAIEGTTDKPKLEPEPELEPGPSPAKKEKKTTTTTKKNKEYDMNSDEEIDFIKNEEIYKKAGILLSNSSDESSTDEDEEISDWEDELVLDPKSGHYKLDPLQQQQPQQYRQRQGQQKRRRRRERRQQQRERRRLAAAAPVGH